MVSLFIIKSTPTRVLYLKTDRCADFHQASPRRSAGDTWCRCLLGEVPTGIDFVSWVLNPWFEQWGGYSSKLSWKPNIILMHWDVFGVICPQEDTHHNYLALAYVTKILQEEEQRESDLRVTRAKLQQLLWESKLYNVSTVYGVWMHFKKANYCRIIIKLW